MLRRRKKHNIVKSDTNFLTNFYRKLGFSLRKDDPTSPVEPHVTRLSIPRVLSVSGINMEIELSLILSK